MSDRQPLDPAQFPTRGAYVRARVWRLLRLSLLFWACAYFALVALSGHTYFRSFAFGLALLFALWLIVGAVVSDGEAIPVPDGYLLAAIAAWALWALASATWSIHPAYSKAEIGTEVGWGVLTAVIFYVAARTDHAFRALCASAVAITVLLAIVAVHATLTMPGFEPDRDLVARHGGVGAFSTLIVLVVPLMPMLLAARPVGFGAGYVSIAALSAAFVTLLAAARVTENRMIWGALAVGFVLAAVLAAWRWRVRLSRAPLRWLGVLVVMIVALSTLFIDAAIQRMRGDVKRDTTVAQAIADDPRLLLWQHTFERIRERPWLGYGFGKSILREELQGELGDPLLAHAHNLFVSQWLQTGVVGLALLLTLLAALGWRYLVFLRASDGTLAAVGLMGIVLLLEFVTKSLTDDFMIRPTSKEFWALNAMLIGYGIRRSRRATP